MAFRHEMLTFSPWPDLGNLMVMEDVAWVFSILSDSLHVITGLLNACLLKALSRHVTPRARIWGRLTKTYTM